MLQGSLDNFRLDEVLDLLSNTTKTGRLRISGDRGTGSVWLQDGQLVSGTVASLDDGSIEDVVFELMRFKSGNFSFTVDETADDAQPSQLVDMVVEAAAERLTEWHDIEAVVPSMDHILTPCPELSVDEVTITSDQWRVLVTIGSRSAVREVCTELGLGEVDGSRMLKRLIESDLIEINEDARGRTEDVAEDSATEAAYSVEDLLVDEEAPAAPMAPESTIAPAALLGAADDAPAAVASTESAMGSNIEEFVVTAPVASTTEAPVAEASMTEPATFETPASETPASETGAAETPAFDTPAFETGAVETPSVEPASVEAPFTNAPFESDIQDAPAPEPEELIEEAVSPFASFEPSETAPEPSEISPFSADLNETAAHMGITDDLPVPSPSMPAPASRDERPPMPAPPSLDDLPAPPPSPAEIENFTSSVHDTSALDHTEPIAPVEEDSTVDSGSTDAEPSSLLMRYLKSER